MSNSIQNVLKKQPLYILIVTLQTIVSVCFHSLFYVRKLQFQRNNHHSKIMQYYDKQNALSFHNITQTMKNKKYKKEDNCFYHQDKQGKYRDIESQILYCKSCAVQQASRGVAIEDVVKCANKTTTVVGGVQEIYQQAQNQIKEHIRLYNKNFQRLMQMLPDMQIRDLLTFNRKIQENKNKFEQIKRQTNGQWDRYQMRQLFKSDANQIILQKIDGIMELISSDKAQASMRSCNLQDKLSPKLSLKNRSQKIQTKLLKLNTSNTSLNEKVIDSHESIRQSFTKSHNTNSYKSKNSTIEEIKKSTYEDTPESIKHKTNQNGLRVTNDMAVTMFQKIDVCQSISLSHQSQSQMPIIENKSQSSADGRASFSSLKSRYRYGKTNQESAQ